MLLLAVIFFRSDLFGPLARVFFLQMMYGFSFACFSPANWRNWLGSFLKSFVYFRFLEKFNILESNVYFFSFISFLFLVFTFWELFVM